jgi:hypothetical protein
MNKLSCQIHDQSLFYLYEARDKQGHQVIFAQCQMCEDEVFPHLSPNHLTFIIDRNAHIEYPTQYCAKNKEMIKS